MLRFLLALVIAAALAALYFFVAMKWSYSTGERVGWVQKLSDKGWVCKTWEGELALVSLPGTAVEKFLFTVREEAIADQIMKNMGKRVSLHYEEKVGLPTTCFGDTRHFVTAVTAAPDSPMGAGVSMPTQPAAPAPAPAPAAVAVPVPAAVAVPAPAPAVAPAVTPAVPAAVAPVLVPAAPAASAAK